MKKIVLALAVILGLGCSQVNAQTTISGGVKADANMANFLLSDLTDYQSTMKVGASLGGFMKVEFNENFALQPELLIHYKASKMEVGNLESNFEYWGAEIPVYAIGQMAMGTGKGFIGVGPYVGLGFDAKMGSADLYKKDSADKSVLNRWDFGIGAIVGYEFSNKISINAGYKIGLIDQMDRGKDDASMKNQTVNLGLGYRF
ncbi:PorT family protein [Bacteroidales bacterium OttesenSCG-928-A17]|nr:PorT family protein [Bacteroidales bacterium OttesenSCG-928-A17]